VELRVSAYGIVTDRRGLLLAHWRDGSRGAWTLPGGGLEPGEHPAAAVVREVEEETGYRVAVEELLGIDSVVVPAADPLQPRAEPVHSLRVIYRARVTGGELRAEAAGSTDRAGWFTAGEVDRLDRVPLVDAGRRLADRL
jgi:8-oxo-dGTP diphosphatase